MKRDVAIVGGGPAGCATALSLLAPCLARRTKKARGAPYEEGAPPELRVIVVETGHHDRDKEGESLPPDTTLVLQELGVLERFREQGFERCPGSGSSWGQDELAYNDFLLSPFGAGWHLDRRRFDAFLAREAESAGAEVLRGARVTRVDRADEGGFRLGISREEGAESEIRARWVVDATGASARVARLFGARRRVHDRLVGVVAFWGRGEGRMTAQSLLEGAEIGWWYAARLPGMRAVSMLVTDPANMARLGLGKEERWRAALRETRHIAAALEGCGASLQGWITRPITPFALDRAWGDGWLAVGDAAGAIDPILAGGVHKALSDGLEAGRALADAAGGGPGAAAAMESYEASVRARFEGLMGNREHLYGLERRFAEAPFWARRFAQDLDETAPRAGD